MVVYFLFRRHILVLRKYVSIFDRQLNKRSPITFFIKHVPLRMSLCVYCVWSMAIFEVVDTGTRTLYIIIIIILYPVIIYECFVLNTLPTNVDCRTGTTAWNINNNNNRNNSVVSTVRAKCIAQALLMSSTGRRTSNIHTDTVSHN